MKTATVIYTGEKPSFSLYKPERRSFQRGVPQTINAKLLRYLPENDFEDFDSSIHKAPDNVKPIAIKLPHEESELLFTIQAVRKIRQFYPFNPIICICRDSAKELLKGIDNLEIVKSYKANPGMYAKEYQPRISKGSPEFSTLSLIAGTKEFSYLQHFGVMYDDDKKKPTLLPIKTKPEHITIVNTGKTKLGTWKDFGEYLSKQKWSMPVKVIDKELHIDEALKIFKTTAYVISTGDSYLPYLAAYLGIPLTCFVHDQDSSWRRQLCFFNNIKPESVNYSTFLKTADPKRIFSNLQLLIDNILSGKPVVREEPVQNKVSTPKKENANGRKVPTS